MSLFVLTPLSSKIIEQSNRNLFCGNSQVKIAIGSDHHGKLIRAGVTMLLRGAGNEVLEFGPAIEENKSVDYPDIASEVASRVHDHSVDRGILICGTGIGMCIVANKFSGVRAAPIIDDLSAELSRRHNDLNVLCLSGEMLTEEAIRHIVEIWLKTPFDGGRHEKRLRKISQIEEDGGLSER
ncbi:MAG: ribose 5-phosphate isomerase B [Thermoguttaceae bacterium]